MDEDKDQHSHPLFRMSPGMKMLGAEEEKESNVTERRNERPPRNEVQYSQEITKTTFQKCGDIHEPPTGPTHGKATDEDAWSEDQSPSLKQ